MATKKKQNKSPKSMKFQIRISEFHYNRIRWLADHYANGNMSAWLTHAGLNAPRKYLSKRP